MTHSWPGTATPSFKCDGYGLRLVDTGVITDAGEIAKREDSHRMSVNDLLRIDLLAPSTVEVAIGGGGRGRIHARCS